MEINVDKLFNDLEEKKGTSLHKPVSLALNILGFETYTIKESDVEPDILAFSSEKKYALIIEVTACENSSIPSRKVVQIRQNGERYKQSLKNEGYNSPYLVIVGRPYFSKKIDKVSEGDVCLLSINDLIKLIKLKSEFNITTKDLEVLFANSGKSIKSIDYLSIKSKKPFLICGLILYEINKRSKSDMNIDLVDLIKSVKILGNFVFKNYNIIDDEVMTQILFLSNNLFNFLTISDERTLKLKEINFINQIEIKFGKIGEKMVRAYEYCSEQLKTKSESEIEEY